jgi:hypothetical protein
MDFCGLQLENIYQYSSISYSRYPVVEVARSISANITVPILDKVLSNFGIQEVIKKQIMEVSLIHRHSKSLPLTAALPTDDNSTLAKSQCASGSIK